MLFGADVTNRPVEPFYTAWTCLCHSFLCFLFPAPKPVAGLLSDRAKLSPAVVASAPFSKSRAPVFGNAAARVGLKQPSSVADASKPTSKATNALRCVPCMQGTNSEE